MKTGMKTWKVLCMAMAAFWIFAMANTASAKILTGPDFRLETYAGGTGTIYGSGTFKNYSHPIQSLECDEAAGFVKTVTYYSNLGNYGFAWHGRATYCIEIGKWVSADSSKWTAQLDAESFTFVAKGSGGTYSGRILSYEPGKSISMIGEAAYNLITIKTPQFNSPFIYIQNPPKGKIDVTINSPLQKYTSQIPAFTLKNGWMLDSDGIDTFMNSQKVGKLFYELAIDKIELTRNGKTFDSKESLLAFLNGSDFYKRFGFSEAQKQDSISYIAKKIQSSPHYYLTILDDASVSKISSLNVSPKPENINRRYFAIYPTSTPIKTYGDLKYPSAGKVSGFSVTENGEVYVSNDMVVLWK